MFARISKSTHTVKEIKRWDFWRHGLVFFLAGDRRKFCSQFVLDRAAF